GGLRRVLAGGRAGGPGAEAERGAAQTVELLTVPGPPVVESPLVVGRDVVVRPAQPGVPPPTFTQNGRFAVASVPVMTADGEVLVQARASLHPAAAALDTLRSVLLPGVPALLLL